MPIPTSKRVTFGANPLAKVVCQLRFPRLLEIDEQLPVDFQIALRSRFPELTVQQQLVLEITVGASDPVRQVQPAYDFSNEAGTKQVSLTSSFVALTYTNYEDWEGFVADVSFVTSELIKIYEIPYFTRTGLRYIDIIDRATLGLEGVPWSKLVRPELLGALGSELFDENDVQEFSSITVGRTSAGQVRLSSSLAKPNEGTDPHGLSIDADFFSEEKIRADINECADLLGRFNKEAGNLFRWCIKAPLYDALQPA